MKKINTEKMCIFLVLLISAFHSKKYLKKIDDKFCRPGMYSSKIGLWKKFTKNFVAKECIWPPSIFFYKLWSAKKTVKWKGKFTFLVNKIFWFTFFRSFNWKMRKCKSVSIRRNKCAIKILCRKMFFHMIYRVQSSSLFKLLKENKRGCCS